MIKIPAQDKKFLQTNNSDIEGNLYATFNCDLSENEGKIRAGERLLISSKSASLANLGTAVGFRAFIATGINGSQRAIFTVAGSRVFYNTGTPESGFAQDATSGTPTTCSSATSDLEIFNGSLYVTTASSTVYKLGSDGTWSNFATTGTDTASSHQLLNYASRMYMTRVGLQIISWNTSDVVSLVGSQYAIQLYDGDSASLQITFIRASSNRIWIGTISKTGGKGYVYEWDGSSSQVTKSYRLESSGAIACVIQNDVPVVIDTNGRLLIWNGGAFKDFKSAGVGVDALLNRINKHLLYNPLGSTNDRFVHPNGMTIIDGKISVLVNTQNYNSVRDTEITMPAGVYEYDPEKGLNHKYSFSQMAAGDTTVPDIGMMKVAGVGAISEINIPSTSSTRNGTFLCGGSYYTDATTAAFGIFYDDIARSKKKGGNFVTTKIQAQQLDEVWQKIYTVFRKFLSANDLLVVKYRVVEDDPTEATVTWNGVHELTSVADLSAYAIGDEVEILNGSGAGKCAHISNIVNNSGTYVITLDSDFTGITNGTTAIARFDTWVKIGSLATVGKTILESAIGKPTTWIQIKVYFEFFDKDEIESLVISHISNIKVQ